MIVIVDYGAGNLKSVYNMLSKAGAESVITNQGRDVRTADKVILPGVGHFGHGMRMLRSMGLVDDLEWFANVARKPLLGICLGAQMLGHGSEEAAGINGLGWIDMYCKRFPDNTGLRVPNMGWNKIECNGNVPLLGEQTPESRYYFVHSYYMDCRDQRNIAAYSDYGIRYASAVCRDNIFGIQFHPEKSHRYGMMILKNFWQM